MTVLADNAFCNCAELEEVTIPAKVSEIAYNAFKDCKKLKKVTITDGVKTVSSAAFGNCDSLTEIVFPASVTKVKEPFRYNSNDCDKLTSITFENAACEISSVYGLAEKPVTLYGYANSTAQKYAEDFGEERFVKFALIGTAPADNTKDTGLFCDANGNGEIDVADAQFVLIYYVEQMAGNSPSWYAITKNPKAPDAP